MDRTASGPRRAATVRDVAAAAGVSIASVSRVINGTGPVAEPTRGRVNAAIERLRYVPHHGAASLVRRRNDVLGLLLPELHGEFFAELVHGIEGAARPHGQRLLVCHLTGNDEEDARTLRDLHGRVDGLLLMASHEREDRLARHLSRDLPAVLLNTRLDSSRSILMIDNYGAARQVVEHLVACGRRKIAHIAGPAGNYDAEERARGWRDGLAIHGLGGEVPWLEGDFEQESGIAAGRAVAAMRERPDAIFAANDLMAAGAMRALCESGLRVPEDIAIVGFDDIPLASLLDPALTTVRVDIAAFGRRALERLARIIEEPELSRERLEPVRPALVVRESCGASPRVLLARA